MSCAAEVSCADQRRWPVLHSCLTRNPSGINETLQREPWERFAVDNTLDLGGESFKKLGPSLHGRRDGRRYRARQLRRDRGTAQLHRLRCPLATSKTGRWALSRPLPLLPQKEYGYAVRGAPPANRPSSRVRSLGAGIYRQASCGDWFGRRDIRKTCAPSRWP